MLLWVMVIGSENSPLVEPRAEEMIIGSGWEMDVYRAERKDGLLLNAGIM